MIILTKIILVAIGIWWISLALLFIFPFVLPELSGLSILLSLPVALILLILTLVALIKEKRRLWTVVCFVLIIAVTYFALRQVTYLGALAHLYLNKRSYETTAARMLAAHDNAERRRICGERCLVLSDNPGRVAFRYVHRFWDWDDLVYDPSGEIIAINNNWDEKKRLNTYYIEAKHLTGDWYLASFGD